MPHALSPERAEILALEALAWLAAGKLNVAGLASAYSPVRAQEVYEGLLSQSFPTPTALFDWRLL